jgi:hypothetical protein
MKVVSQTYSATLMRHLILPPNANSRSQIISSDDDAARPSSVNADCANVGFHFGKARCQTMVMSSSSVAGVIAAAFPSEFF